MNSFHYSLSPLCSQQIGMVKSSYVQEIILVVYCSFHLVMLCTEHIDSLRDVEWSHRDIAGRATAVQCKRYLWNFHFYHATVLVPSAFHKYVQVGRW